MISGLQSAASWARSSFFANMLWQFTVRIESDLCLLCLARGDDVETGIPIDVSIKPDEFAGVSGVDSARS